MKKDVKGLNKYVEGFEAVIRSLIKPLRNKDGWGRDEVIAVAIALVIAAFVVAPGLRSFAEDVVGSIQGWYNTNIETQIFDTN